MAKVTISAASDRFLGSVKMARAENTARTYGNALAVFMRVLQEHWIEPAIAPAADLKEDAVIWLAAYLKTFAPATERLYLQAVSAFYHFLAAERLSDVNLPRLQLLIRQRGRRPGIRLPQFPVNDIVRVLDFFTSIANVAGVSEAEQLRALRDRAFLLTLADTGLRVHEACALRRGDIDWNEGRAVIIGKGDKQAVVRFSTRAMSALKEYLTQRAALDGGSGKQLSSLPLFARHDRGAGKKIKPITTATGRDLVAERVRQALGEEAEGHITPHSFRHYFVTTVLRGSGNLKLAQALARHSNIQVTQRYAHLSDDELDKGYHEIFEKPAGDR
ncbi:MAG TPA: tyrosine-type recombinase/integrase [Anaerolineales bacterium]